MLDKYSQFLPLLIPLVVVQLALLVIALIDLNKQVETRGPKWMWVLIIIFVNTIGPIVYFFFGRKEE